MANSRKTGNTLSLDGQQEEVEERPNREVTERVPMHARDILTVKGKDDGNYYRWCLDINNKLERYQAAGYEFVTDTSLAIGELTVNPTTQTGQVISLVSGERTLYLMYISKDLYHDDARAKAIEVDKLEQTMEQQANPSDKYDYGGLTTENQIRRG